jgi:heme/copper-type cytochrome/quinol oxidase subunit 4
MLLQLPPAAGGNSDQRRKRRQRMHFFGVALAVIATVLAYFLLFAHPWSERTTALAVLTAIVVAGCGAMLAASSPESE